MKNEKATKNKQNLRIGKIYKSRFNKKLFNE